MNVIQSEICNFLKKYKKITVIGLSPDEAKPSHGVPMFMKENGYQIVGVYPGVNEIKGIKIYSTLAEVPKEYRAFVNVFRRSEQIPTIVEEVLKCKDVQILWLQLGITNHEAEILAENAGIKVVSNRCLKIEFDRCQK